MFNIQEFPQFKNEQEELVYLRNAVKEKLNNAEIPIKSEHAKTVTENLVEKTIVEYKKIQPEHVLAPNMIQNETRSRLLSDKLTPETHDTQIAELQNIMIHHGIKNTLEVIAHMRNPHIEDDFHRFLIAFLLDHPDFKTQIQSQELLESSSHTLYEVVMPREQEKKDNKEGASMSIMEQFFSGMQSLTYPHDNKPLCYSIEMAMSCDSPHIYIYVSIPNDRRTIFEKQVTALYPQIRLSVAKNDYNVFNPSGFSMGAFADTRNKEYLPIRTYTEFERDPLYVISNVFSKLKNNGEGASVQFVISHTSTEKYEYFKRIQKELTKNSKLKDAISKAGRGTFGKIWHDLIGTDEKKKDDKGDGAPNNEAHVTEKVNEKLKYFTLPVSIRIVTSAETINRTQEILHDMTSAFHQFADPLGNSLKFTQVNGDRLGDLFHNFVYRLPSKFDESFLNTKELATLIHFPEFEDSPNENMKTATMASSPAPVTMAETGIVLGDNVHRGSEKEVIFGTKDRVRHMYIIGQTGTGKTNLMINMIVQDIKNGEGVCYIDPHGTDIQTILGHIPPERYDDIIYFDPAYMPRPIGLNMMEYDITRPEQKTLVIDELMGIFNQLFDMKAQGGAMFQQYFKNSAFLCMDHPESGNTLLELTRVLADEDFRNMKLSHCRNPIVKQFWVSAEQTTGEQSLANFVPYLSSKFDPLISNEILRPVVTQEHSAFNLREIMDNKKVLLVNLSKGRMGELNANLIGLIIVGKIQMAALSRADAPDLSSLPPFYLYIDEFQNVTTPAIASILSEARKYKLSLNVAHQYLKQLDDDIKNAVLGNVGSMALFRISAEDAEALEPRVGPVFTKKDIIGLENYNAYMSMLVDGSPVPSFNNKCRYSSPPNPDQIEHLKKLSYMKYGRPREEVEAEIMAKYSQGH